MCYAQSAQRLGNELISRTVERSVNYLKLRRDLCHNSPVDSLSEHLLKVGLVRLGSDHFDSALG